MNADTTTQPSPLRSWARLLRISAAPTAATNVLAGFLLTQGSWQPVSTLVLLVFASMLLYLSGMVLNDLCDIEADRKDRSHRPLPAGDIRVSAAWKAYATLTVCGLFLALVANPLSSIVAAVLVIAIVTYNRILKHTIWAPLAMGGCRTLNILMAASGPIAIADLSKHFDSTLLFWIAISLGLFVLGITAFARNETQQSNRSHLIMACVAILTGLGGYLTAAYWATSTFEIATATRDRYALIIGFVSLPILWRIGQALLAPTPAHVQMAVISMLRSLIFLDAAVCFLLGPDTLFYPLVVLAFLVPSTILGKWISST